MVEIKHKIIDNNYTKMSSFTIRYETSDGLKRFYIIFNKISWHIEDNNGSKYLTFIHVDENKGAIKM